MSDERDPIIDTLLDEVVGEKSPPDLTARILETLAATGHPGPVAPPVQCEPSAPAAPPLLAPTPANRSSRPLSGWKIAGGVAAVVLIGAGLGLALLMFNQGPPEVVESVPRPASARPDSDDTDKPNAPGDNPGALAVDSSTGSSGKGSDGGSDGGSAFNQPPPFAANTSPGSNPPSPPSAPNKPLPLSDEQVVAIANKLVSRAWTESNVRPSAKATDAEFCRRMFLALVGRIPTVDELTGFLDDVSPEKRRHLVAQLQGEPHRDEYVRNWMLYWTNALIGRSGGARPDGLVSREGLQLFLKSALQDGARYDRMVFDLLTASGSNRPGAEDFNGAVNFLLDGMTKDATLATARTARIFHGKQIRCVQCHNHPTNESWTQNQFWELNAFFRQMHVEKGPEGLARLSDADFRGESPDGDDEAEIYYERLDGVKRVAYPVFLDGTALAKSGRVDEVNRRRALSGMIIRSPDFSRAVVNRLWSRFLRYGFTKPIDDMGPHNAVSHPELLDHLAEQFVAHDHDLNKLVRWIVSTEAFGLSSRIADNVADAPREGRPPLFSRYYTRQLSPEAVYDSLLLAADMRTKNRGIGDHIQAQRTWLNQFTRNMGTDEGDETNTFNGDIRQSVIIMTSPIMKRAVGNQQGGVLHLVANSKLTTNEKIEHLFLASLSRKPTSKELVAVRRIVEANRGDETRGLQDVWWALLNSNEFILDH